MQGISCTWSVGPVRSDTKVLSVSTLRFVLTPTVSFLVRGSPLGIVGSNTDVACEFFLLICVVATVLNGIVWGMHALG